MKLVSVFNNAYQVKNKNYSLLKRAYLDFKHANPEERDKLYKVYEETISTVIRESKEVGEIHGSFTYNVQPYFSL